MSDSRGFDYEGIGALMGLNRDLYATQANAIQTINKANAEIEKGNVEIRRLRKELAHAQAALRVETAHTAGLIAQAVALKAELERVDRGNILLTPTGLTYPDGKRHISLHKIYEAAFDNKALQIGLADPHSARHIAK